VHPLAYVLTLLVMLLGLFGVVVPVLPGLLLVWIAAVVSTLVVGADLTGWALVAVLTLLFAGGTAATIWLPTRQGRQGGVPLRSFGAAGVGAVVGFFAVPIVGFLLGAGAGLAVAEYHRLGDWPQTRRSLATVVRGYGLGVVVELGVGLTMILVWGLGVLLR
jgi:uncharacterized protein